jgi:hypothetical protein
MSHGHNRHQAFAVLWKAPRNGNQAIITNIAHIRSSASSASSSSHAHMQSRCTHLRNGGAAKTAGSMLRSNTTAAAAVHGRCILTVPSAKPRSAHSNTHVRTATHKHTHSLTVFVAPGRTTVGRSPKSRDRMTRMTSSDIITLTSGCAYSQARLSSSSRCLRVCWRATSALIGFRTAGE